MKLLTLSLGRRMPLAVTAVGIVAATAIAIPMANASERPAAPQVRSLSALARTLDANNAGGWVDASGQTIVNVTDQAGANQVRAAGGTPRMVAFSGATLKSTEATLRQMATVPGTAWVMDPKSNRVVVSVDQSVTGAKLATVQAAVDSVGGTVRMQRVAGTIATRITGGDAIFTGNARCSLGFNVVNAAKDRAFFLTAGHCTNAGTAWFADQAHQQSLGQTVASSFPGDDFGVVQLDAGVVRPGAFRLADGTQRDITGAIDAVVGQSVERSGSTSGVHSGTVTGLNATVNYAEGTVTGLIQTDVCAEAGDSGGALVAGDKAVGLTSGGSGDCTQGGETFFQPVTEPLQKFGLQVY